MTVQACLRTICLRILWIAKQCQDGQLLHDVTCLAGVVQSDECPIALELDETHLVSLNAKGRPASTVM